MKFQVLIDLTTNLPELDIDNMANMEYARASMYYEIGGMLEDYQALAEWIATFSADELMNAEYASKAVSDFQALEQELLQHQRAVVL